MERDKTDGVSIIPNLQLSPDMIQHAVCRKYRNIHRNSVILCECPHTFTFSMGDIVLNCILDRISLFVLVGAIGSNGAPCSIHPFVNPPSLVIVFPFHLQYCTTPTFPFMETLPFGVCVETESAGCSACILRHL